MSKKVIAIDVNKGDIYQNFRKDIGEYFFRLRSKKNMSLAQLRDKTGIKPERIDRLEVGRAKFDSSAILALLKLHDVKAYIVLCHGEEMKVD